MKKGDKKMTVLLVVGICVILGVIGQMLMKVGMSQVGKITAKEIFSTRLFSVITNQFVFAGIVFYGVASVLWLSALSMEEVSYIYPLIGTGYILVAILSWLFLKENLTVMRFVGVVLISIGAYLVVAKW